MPKQNYTRMVTPTGVAQYAWLIKPDTRFDAVGHYKTNLILSREDAANAMQMVDKAMTESLTLAKENAKGKKIKEGSPPYMEELDDNGEPTGNIIFKFKTKAEIISKDGSVIPNKVAIFDSQGTPMTDTDVWSGSELKVSADIVPYYTAIVGAGVSLRLRAVQVIKLVQGGDGATGYGFDAIDDGYTAKDTANEEVLQEEETATADF